MNSRDCGRVPKEVLQPRVSSTAGAMQPPIITLDNFEGLFISLATSYPKNRGKEDAGIQGTRFACAAYTSVSALMCDTDDASLPAPRGTLLQETTRAVVFNVASLQQKQQAHHIVITFALIVIRLRSVYLCGKEPFVLDHDCVPAEEKEGIEEHTQAKKILAEKKGMKNQKKRAKSREEVEESKEREDGIVETSCCCCDLSRLRISSGSTTMLSFTGSCCCCWAPPVAAGESSHSSSRAALPTLNRDPIDKVDDPPTCQRPVGAEEAAASSSQFAPAASGWARGSIPLSASALSSAAVFNGEETFLIGCGFAGFQSEDMRKEIKESNSAARENREALPEILIDEILGLERLQRAKDKEIKVLGNKGRHNRPFAAETRSPRTVCSSDWSVKGNTLRSLTKPPWACSARWHDGQVHGLGPVQSP
ncbi:unnamed protein product [Notodromas monacha]|uniref:Uncharacterized protein n=1 Tax=Notodromas monacha TaxID=399045 RepID=A0A7R9GHE9_9CRUS|nr:unnamed protein product [Notodromas monacha]CAG0921255.1 unnamed protein product [Notodromas monacha]